jgi:SAM-dependent methyltransferase
MSSIIQNIRRELVHKADEKAQQSGQSFFREQVFLYGVKTAVVSKIAKKYFEEIKEKGAFMTELSPSRFWEIVFRGLREPAPSGSRQPRLRRQSPRSLPRGLPEFPAILDLGCGVGGQTLQLAELTSGSIVAIDSHAPSIERLQAAIARNAGFRSASARSSEIWPI